MEWVQGTVSLEVKRPEFQADQSPQSIAEVNNAWSCIYIPPYIFMSLYLVEYRYNFTLLYLWSTFEETSGRMRLEQVKSDLTS